MSDLKELWQLLRYSPEVRNILIGDLCLSLFVVVSAYFAPRVGVAVLLGVLYFLALTLKRYCDALHDLLRGAPKTGRGES